MGLVRLSSLQLCNHVTDQFSHFELTQSIFWHLLTLLPDSSTSCRLRSLEPKPVSDTIQRYGLSHHSYADDTQLDMTMDHSNNDWRDGLARIELCVCEIREWIKQNMLKLNDDKTELGTYGKTCSMAIPAMRTRPMTPIIGRNTLGSCPLIALSFLKGC